MKRLFISLPIICKNDETRFIFLAGLGFNQRNTQRQGSSYGAIAKAIGACGLAQLPAPYYSVIISNGLLSGIHHLQLKGSNHLEAKTLKLKI